MPRSVTQAKITFPPQVKEEYLVAWTWFASWNMRSWLFHLQLWLCNCMCGTSSLFRTEG